MRCCAPPKIAAPRDAVIRTARSRWQGVVLVCGKCSRKLDGGFGPDGDVPLAKALRRRAGKGKRATAGVIETKCLKLCPKGAVVVMDAAHPDRWLLVPAGEPIDVVAEQLGLGGAQA